MNTCDRNHLKEADDEKNIPNNNYGIYAIPPEIIGGLIPRPVTPFVCHSLYLDNSSLLSNELSLTKSL